MRPTVGKPRGFFPRLGLAKQASGPGSVSIMFSSVLICVPAAAGGFVLSLLSSVFICVHLWFQSYLFCPDASAIYDDGMRATKLESARCEH